jgi:hypothetical protein
MKNWKPNLAPSVLERSTPRSHEPFGVDFLRNIKKAKEAGQ